MSPLKRLAWLVPLLAAPISLASGQEVGVAYGTVRDTAGAAIPRVQLRVMNTELRTTVEANGHYRIGAIPAGRVVLNAWLIGYRQAFDTIEVVGGDSVQVDVILAPSPLTVGPIVVTAAKRSQFLDQAVTSVALVSDSEIARRAVSTVDEAVNKAPGVLFLNGQVNIRGSSGFVEGLGSRVLLLVDGVPANQGDRGGIDWDMLPLEEVDRVEVVKGAGSSLYGSAAFGGVVNVITHDLPVGFHGRVRATAGQPRRDVPAAAPQFHRVRAIHVSRQNG